MRSFTISELDPARQAGSAQPGHNSAEAVASLLSRPVTDAEQQRRSAIFAAQKTAACCAHCRRPLQPDEPIWRSFFSLGRGFFGGSRRTIAPVCKECSGNTWRYRNPKPCEGCQRSVYREQGNRDHRRCFCCDACRKRVAVVDAREKRRRTRSTQQCATCGEMFEPPRTDAKFCSSPCRQRAYRTRALRITKAYHTDAFNSRNGDGAGR